MLVQRNAEVLGKLSTASGMHFSFCDLLAHVTRTRALGSGTILGAGTVSSAQIEDGVACLAEARALETIAHGAPQPPWLRVGERLRLSAHTAAGDDVFGAIESEVIA